MPGLMDLPKEKTLQVQQLSNDEHTITVQPLEPETEYNMRILTLKGRKKAVKQFDTAKNNPTVTLKFSCDEETQEYALPFRVAMNFCPAIETAVKQAKIKVTDQTVLSFILQVDNLICVPAVMDYLSTYKDLIDNRGRIKGIGKADKYVVSTYNETLKIAKVLGMTSLIREMEAYLQNLQYTKGKPSWTIRQDDLGYVLDHSEEGYWLRKELATSIAKAKRDKVLRNQAQIMKFLQRDHRQIHDVIVRYIAQLDAAEKAQKEEVKPGKP